MTDQTGPRESHDLPLDEIHREVDAMTASAQEGPGLSKLTHAFIELGLAMSVTALNLPAGRAAMEDVLSAGGTHDQIQEILVLVSALGVHTLLEGTRMASTLAAGDRLLDLGAPLNQAQAALHAQYVGDRSYWRRFEARVPGFLDALLRMSPPAFEGFFQYCALPARSSRVPSLDRELVSIAADATPAHRYLPTLRMHVENALALGAGHRAIAEALRLGAAAPPHAGIR